MRLARNSLYTLTASLIPLVLAIVTVPFFVTEIGAERYGALAIAWLLLGYFGAADFGIGRAITQRVAAMQLQNAADQASAVWAALISITGLAFITAGLLYLFAGWYFREVFEVSDGPRGEMIGAIWLLALCNPVVAINGVLAGALMGREQFKLVAFANTIANSGLLLFPLAVAYFISVDLKYLIAASMGARILGMVIVGASVWGTMLKNMAVHFDLAEFRAIANFGVWVMVSALVGPLMLFADRFLIGAVYDAAAVAAYAIPYQIAVRTMLLPNAVTQALFPRFAAEKEAASRQRCGEFVVMIGLIFAPVIIGLVCLAGPLLELWLGYAFDVRSVAVAQWILVGCWFNAIALVPFSFLQARGFPRFTALLHVAELPAFVLLLWVLGSQFGLAGFAAAYALRCAGDCAVLLIKAGAMTAAIAARLITPAALIGAAMLSATIWSGPAALLAAGVALGLFSLASIAFHMPEGLRARFVVLPVAGPLLGRLWG